MKDIFEKAYEPNKYESDLYNEWLESGFFAPENLPGVREKTFSMVLPPPNVTGTLHLGHAAMLAIEDVFTRHARLSGCRTLWLPGTDHAAIATQTKVEKILIAEGVHDPKHTLGREDFLSKVEAFAQDSHDTIVGQAKRMGASLDWSREAYTLDEERSVSVREAFKLFFEAGLLYQGYKVVNWCPRCQSTLSDDELVHVENEASLYTFKYNKEIPISISSTRPETKVGDVAIAVSPKDERFAKFIGQEFACDFAGSAIRLRVVSDIAVEADFGTGALGVTPAHSKIDEEISLRHELPMKMIIGEDGRMLDEAGDLVRGDFVTEARDKIVNWLREQNLLESEEKIKQNTPICYRCDTVVESLPKKQWFIDVNKKFPYKKPAIHPIHGLEDKQMISLKEIMLHVIKVDQIKIIPERFEKTYFNWIENLRDWNVSRQIWFGHRIPVWYNGEKIYVGTQAPEGDGWIQDEDTLDTWFSSGIWTCSTLGWPNQTNDLNSFHPTTVLETGYDILFFWVARMILMTTFLTGQVPFKDVYLHGLVRDEEGQKMSKSLGNVIDPLTMIDKYGADATRLALIIGGSPGNDMKLSEEKIAGFRNFTNKLWNISRFVLTSIKEPKQISEVSPRTVADRWILSQLERLTEKVSLHLDSYEVSLAGEALRDFTWSSFADWYLEIAKVQREETIDNGSTDKILLYVLERILIMWHPFMPFVTEEIWKHFSADSLLVVQKWPVVTGFLAEEAEDKFAQIQETIVAIRNLRASYRIEPKLAISVYLEGDTEMIENLLVYKDIFARLAKTESMTAGDLLNDVQTATSIVRGVTVRMLLDGIIDTEKECQRIEKAIQNLLPQIKRLKKQLDNQEFIQNAPEAIIKGMRIKLEETEATCASLNEELVLL